MPWSFHRVSNRRGVQNLGCREPPDRQLVIRTSTQTPPRRKSGEDTSALLSALKAVTVTGTVVLLVVRVRSRWAIDCGLSASHKLVGLAVHRLGLAALAGLRSLLQNASRVFKAAESFRGVALKFGSKVESHAAVLHEVVIQPCSEPKGLCCCFRSAPRHIWNQQHALACKGLERLLHRILPEH